MVNSKDISEFVEGTLKPLSEGKKAKGTKKTKKVEESEVVETTRYEFEDRVTTGCDMRVTIIPEGEKKDVVTDEQNEETVVVNDVEDQDEVKEEKEKKKGSKKDKVLVALEGIDDNSVDLLFFDPFNRLGGKEVVFKTPADRDKYIKRVQGWLTEAYKKLNPKGGNMVIGASAFTLTSFGDELFPTADVKRMLSWYRETERSELTLDRGYIPTVTPFLWGVRGKPWTFNLQGDEKFFDGEFKVDGGKGSDAMALARQVVRRYSNEGDTVLELFGSKTVIREAVELEKRNYVSGYVTT